MSAIKLVSVGADPEFFLVDREGKPVPCVNVIGGTKGKPIFINEDGHSAIQEDNVMVEYNVKPATSAEEFVTNHEIVLRHLKKLLDEKKLTAMPVGHMKFPMSKLQSKQAKWIGCEIDFNAWTELPNPKIDHKMLKTIRTAGGHVHIGVSADSIEDIMTSLVKACDLFLGVPSVLIDDDVTRRAYYGRAGSFRPKEYGIEYRPLSNFWITQPNLIRWVYRQCEQAVNAVNEEEIDFDRYRTEILSAINNGNKGFARKLVDKFGIRLPLYAVQ